MSQAQLSRREREIMDIVYRRGPASVSDVMQRLSESPGYSAVRTMLRRLEEKGHLKHVQEGTQYVYSPTVARSRARESALRRVVDTFFEGSTGKLVSAILDRSVATLTREELDELEATIARARRENGR